MIIFGLVLLVVIWFIWKLFASGWLFKTILFFAGWIGVYVVCAAFIEGGHNTAVTVGSTGYSLAAVIATVVCFLALLTTRVKDD